MILKISRMLRGFKKHTKIAHAPFHTLFWCGFKFIWSRSNKSRSNARLAGGLGEKLPSPVAFSHPHERTLIFYVTLCELTKLN